MRVLSPTGTRGQEFQQRRRYPAIVVGVDLEQVPRLQNNLPVLVYLLRYGSTYVRRIQVGSLTLASGTAATICFPRHAYSPDFQKEKGFLFLALVTRASLTYRRFTVPSQSI